MSIILPWFPDGDPTAPTEISIWHRAVGDYYQTYDLLITDYPLPHNLPLAYPGLLCERYTPYPRPTGVDWFERYVDWISKWAGYTSAGSNPNIPSPPQFPIRIGNEPGGEIELHYLTWDQEVGGVFGLPRVTVLSWVREKVTLGQNWTPRYPIVPNTLGALAADGSDFPLPLEGDAARYLLPENWDWPTPTENDNSYRYLLSYSRTTTESAFTPAWVERIPGDHVCLNHRVIEWFWVHPRDPNILWIPGFGPAWIGPTPGGDCFRTEAYTFNEAESIEDRPPMPENLGEGAVLVVFIQGERYDCERVKYGDRQFSRTENTWALYASPLSSDGNEENILFYFYARTGNNNPWGFQPTANWERGKAPVLYTSNKAAPDENNTVPSPDVGPRRSPHLEVKHYESQTSGPIPGSRLRFFSCGGIGAIYPFGVVEDEFGGGRYTSHITGFTTSIHWDPEYTENPEDIPTPLDKVEDPLSVFDNYWLSIEEVDGRLELQNTMPDSIRIKEIHAALEANRFGSGTLKKKLVRPDGSEQEINNTLAAQIEAVQEAVQAFNFPGVFQSYRFVLSDEGVKSQDKITFKSLPELIYKLYQELALVLGPGAISSPTEDRESPIEYRSIQDQLDDVLTNQGIHFGVTSSLSIEAKRTLWILGQVLTALGIPVEMQELDLGELGKVPVPKVSPLARSIRQAIDDIQVNLTPRL